MKALFTIFIALFLTSCMSVGGYRVQERHFDRIDGGFTTYSVDLQREPLFLLSTLKFEEDNGNFFYVLQVEYNGTDWLFMDGNVVIDAGGRIIRKKDGDPNRVVGNAGRVSETIGVILSPEEFTAMAQADRVRIEYYGPPTTLNEQAQSNLKQFYDEHGPGA